MERRKFFKKSLSYGTAAGTSLFFLRNNVYTQEAHKKKLNDKIEKVKMAMLTMQRHAWEQGVAAQALLELGESELVILMAKEAALRQLKDGRLAVITANQGVTDPAANGEAVLYAAKVTGDPLLRRAADKMLDYLLNKAPKTKDGTLHHIANKPQVWIDSVYMAPPFIAIAGRPDEAVKQIEGFRRLLWNPEKKLFSHIWDDGLISGEWEMAGQLQV
jgi:unsaturated rhamnogalacturonyl hydrolase